MTLLKCLPRSHPIPRSIVILQLITRRHSSTHPPTITLPRHQIRSPKFPKLLALLAVGYTGYGAYEISCGKTWFVPLWVHVEKKGTNPQAIPEDLKDALVTKIISLASPIVKPSLGLPLDVKKADIQYRAREVKMTSHVSGVAITSSGFTRQTHQFSTHPIEWILGSRRPTGDANQGDIWLEDHVDAEGELILVGTRRATRIDGTQEPNAGLLHFTATQSVNDPSEVNFRNAKLLVTEGDNVTSDIDLLEERRKRSVGLQDVTAR
ncbi:uncharacterized protein VTP21DRAFT_8756 [Calcarisporiella thermophila]|uniref:uncharacterized protein n=1 Tax=Calcarisporiella thermophila TaxID=911321 RepID=UPI003742C07A